MVAVVDPWSGALALEGLEGASSEDAVVVEDEAGRTSAITLADGTWILARYDPLGRVASLEGPGRARWRFTWGDALTVLDPLGRSMTIVREPLLGGGELVAVEDALGRVARTWYASDGVQIDALEDPRGLRTSVRRDGETLRLEDATGRAWTLTRDSAGRVVEASVPSGGLWRWERDEAGRVIRVSDPAGRLTRWDRDEAGRVVAVVRGGQPWRLERDEAGRVSAIEDPVGGRVQLRRDAQGRVITILDAGGDEIRLTRARGAWPTSVLERNGGRWALDLDLLARPSGVADPTGRRVSLERDSAGHLSAVRDSRGRLIRLRWSASGLLSRVEDARGRAVAYLHDALGRLSGLRWDEGDELALARDMSGNVVAVQRGDARVQIGRDALGYPISVGAGPDDEVRWTRDGGSRVVGLSAPSFSLRLDREASGLVRAASTEGWSVQITRDALGRPIRWSGDDGDIELVRDPAGRVRASKGPYEVQLERDARGLVSRARMGELEWRWLRDATGRPLRVSGPFGLSLGVDWDEAGRPVLLRGPNGALARWLWDGAAALERWTDAEGADLSPAREPCDGAWMPDSEDSWRWESADGCASPVKPWGLNGDRLALSRAEDGSVARVVGPEGSVSLERDALGRLRAVVPDDGRGVWRFRYDARGRLALVETPSGGRVPLSWSPEGDLWPQAGGSPSLLLATGENAARAWLTGPSGLVGAAEASWTATLLPDGVGSPVWVQLAGQPPELVRTSMNGLPDNAAAGIAGARGALQAWAGGPLFSAVQRESWSGPGTIAIDPLSGERLDGLGRWPWGETSEPTRLDPAVWAQETPWHAPLALLEALGALPPIDDAAWTRVETPSPALSWLPASLDAAEPPLGPDPASLPLEEDPLTNAIILGLLRGESGIEPGLPLRVVLEDAFDAPTLPPGISTPRLTE